MPPFSASAFPITLGIKGKLPTMANKASVIRGPHLHSLTTSPPTLTTDPTLERTQLILIPDLLLAGPPAGMLFIPSELRAVHFFTSFRCLIRCHLHCRSALSTNEIVPVHPSLCPYSAFMFLALTSTGKCFVVECLPPPGKCELRAGKDSVIVVITVSSASRSVPRTP